VLDRATAAWVAVLAAASGDVVEAGVGGQGRVRFVGRLDGFAAHRDDPDGPLT
jgi:hypothetical protein